VPNRLRGRVFGLSDVATMAGLLLATGLIGIPEWPHIDRWVGWILVGVAVVVLATSISSFAMRLGGGTVRAGQRWMNVNEFYCRSWFRLKREGICTVPREGPVVVVANHTCAIDPILIIASCPHRPVGFLIAEEYYDLPVFGRIIKVVDCIPVRRGQNDVGAFKAALRHLESGKVLGVFPAGRIPAPGEAVEYNDGAVALALRSGARVVPVHVSGTKYDESLSKVFFRRHEARVRFGKPVDLAGYGRDVDRKTRHEITRMLMKRVEELGAGPVTVGNACE
jgi:1-acyl-sn-glycerol-3-phosphate acyltransferase